MPNYTTLDTHKAVDCLRAGEVIAYPTEAVYGLGCDPRNESAVRHILHIKKIALKGPELWADPTNNSVFVDGHDDGHRS